MLEILDPVVLLILQQLTELLSGLNDPYAMYLSKPTLSARRNALQSVSTYCGISVQRRFRIPSIGNASFQFHKESIIRLSTIMGTTLICSRAVHALQRPAIFAAVVSGAMVVSSRNHVVSFLADSLYPLEVNSIDPDCQNGIAGLVALGDRIVQVNGINVRYHTVQRVNALLNKGEVGEKVNVLLRRQPIHMKQLNNKDKLKCATSSLQQPAIPSKLLAHPQSEVKPTTWNRLFQIVRNIPKKQFQSLYSSTTFKDSSTLMNISLPVMLARAAPSIEHSVLPITKCGPPVGYMRIKEFHDESFTEFQHAWRALSQSVKDTGSQKIKAVVVDLRGNPGGSLAPALDIAAFFLPFGTCLTRLQGAGRIDVPKSLNFAPDLATALLFLTDRRTASASEILVEALCDNMRAVSVGQRTKGKDFAQVLIFYIHLCVCMCISECV